MKHISILTLAALLTAGAALSACSGSDDSTVDERQQQLKPITGKYNMTVKAGKGDVTRALSLEGTADIPVINAKWAAGEQVQVYKLVAQSNQGQEVKQPFPIGMLTATNISADGQNCTLTGQFDAETVAQAGGISQSDQLVLTFRGSKGYNNNGTIGETLQNGTLERIQDFYDIANAIVTVNSFDGTNISTSFAEFVNQSAIVRFTLLDENDEPLLPQSVRFKELVAVGNSDGLVNEEYIPSVDFEANGGSFFYTTISGIAPLGVITDESIYGVDFAGRITIRAILDDDGEEVYTYTTPENVIFERGKFYNITVKMTPECHLSNVTANDLGSIIGSDGNIYAPSATLPVAVSAEAMIAYVGEVTNVCQQGLAISLTDAYEYNTDYTGATGQYVIPDWADSHEIDYGEGAWRLPSEQDWQYMLWGYYAEDPVPTTISSFQNQLSAAGTGLATNGYYWTSTAVSDSEAKVVLFDGTYAGLQSTGKTQNWHVRACFAF